MVYVHRNVEGGNNKAAGEQLLKTRVTVTEINPEVTRQGALFSAAGGVRPASSGLQGKLPSDSVVWRQKSRYKVFSDNKENNGIKQHVDCRFLRSNHTFSE